MYKFRKIVGKSIFLEQFRKLIKRYKRIGYSVDIMRQTACLVINQSLLMAMLSGLALDDISFALPAWFNNWFSFTLAHRTVSQEYSSLFIIVINLIFMFSL